MGKQGSWGPALVLALVLAPGAAQPAPAAPTAPTAQSTPPAPAIALTPTERQWLEAPVPVLQFARDQALPLDIIVQPQPTPGETPMGLAFVAGRCKLVLSMRGNPEAQATLDRIEPSLVGTVVEAIAAHELGHCWRHLQQQWGSLPEGMDDTHWQSRVTAEQAELLAAMWRTRREEAYADLVALAWTLQRHPDRYAEVHAWHVRFRAQQDVDTGPHDTRLWVQLAQDRQAFGAAPSIFEQVRPLWLAGLRAGLGVGL
ncbi:MAG: hypothetical protein CFE45_06625 [Burkholderiales bacterium PBB5]|nr:MAG: hypothetical protein CFE45_06625 [Burkholderiales bacterium PBB5]